MQVLNLVENPAFYRIQEKNYSELIKDIDDLNFLIPIEGEISILDAFI